MTKKTKSHEVFMAYSSMEQVDCYAEAVHLANNLMDRNIPVQDVARAFVVVAAQYCYVAARRMGYSEMGPAEMKQIERLFSDALRSSNGDIHIRQILPH